MAIFVATNGQLQTIKGIYYGMSEDYINATLFHNIVPKTATEIKFLYTSDNPDLTGYQRIGYADNSNFIEIWNNNTKYIIINPRKNYIYAPINCYDFLYSYAALINCVFDNFDTRNTTNMRALFGKCSSLTSLDLRSFNTQKVTSMRDLFVDCISLSSIDLSTFNIQNTTNLHGIFVNCQSLTSLDLRSFNTQKATIMNYMFHGCNSLTSIISNTFDITSLSSSTSMFKYCTSLVGGNGTAFSSSHITAEYARVDGENGLPGYFTAPTN